MSAPAIRSTIRSERPALPQERCVLTLGAFDGVHRGHQELLHAARAAADERDAALVAVTFDPLPRTVLGRGNYPPLAVVERRVDLLHAHGADIVDVLHFDRDVAGVEYYDFVEYLLARYPVCHAVLGYDFVLGKDRAGTAERLADLGEARGFTVQTEPPVLDVDGVPVSSSRIRERILAGDVTEAARLLGRPVTISGECTADDRLDLEGAGTLLRNVVSRHMLPAPGTYAGVLTQSGGSIPVSVVVEAGVAGDQHVWRTVLPFEQDPRGSSDQYTLQLFNDAAASVHAGTGSNAGYWS